ncbi:MAG TPA: AlpA family transcriptional regulator [Rhodanobacteraceae bacterium]
MKTSKPDLRASVPVSAAPSPGTSAAKRTPYMRTTAFDPTRDRVLRRRSVQAMTGLSRSAIYRLISAGAFPQPVRLSANSVGWLASEVGDWVTSRVKATRGDARVANIEEGA